MYKIKFVLIFLVITIAFVSISCLLFLYSKTNKSLIGKWKNNSGTIEFTKDGYFKCTDDVGSPLVCKYKIDNGLAFVIEKSDMNGETYIFSKANTYTGELESVLWSGKEERIYYEIDGNKLTLYPVCWEYSTGRFLTQYERYLDK